MGKHKVKALVDSGVAARRSGSTNFTIIENLPLRQRREYKSTSRVCFRTVMVSLERCTRSVKTASNNGTAALYDRSMKCMKYGTRWHGNNKRARFARAKPRGRIFLSFTDRFSCGKKHSVVFAEKSRQTVNSRVSRTSRARSTRFDSRKQSVGERERVHGNELLTPILI